MAQEFFNHPLNREIRRIMDEQGLKVVELAKRLGVDKATISRYSSGTIQVKESVALRIKQLCGDNRPVEGYPWINDSLKDEPPKPTGDERLLLERLSRLPLARRRDLMRMFFNMLEAFEASPPEPPTKYSAQKRAQS